MRLNILEYNAAHFRRAFFDHHDLFLLVSLPLSLSLSLPLSRARARSLSLSLLRRARKCDTGAVTGRSRRRWHTVPTADGMDMLDSEAAPPQHDVPPTCSSSRPYACVCVCVCVSVCVCVCVCVSIKMYIHSHDCLGHCGRRGGSRRMCA